MVSIQELLIAARDRGGSRSYFGKIYCLYVLLILYFTLYALFFRIDPIGNND
ncbi:hypothetical protein Cha6605_3269 [Chamaesiphon minutus PCC 6605]|uniref:Uncharacterized protein n=1 Tax=Chamaesiphon minutus (strain ATCC 27169 / PCC 6605) TaxID=1173020 RepID=K9UIN2_CHAP6|nr:hypothetical protein Cha6605_3269 [Chamaesiphon minutus PCC 6605]